MSAQVRRVRAGRGADGSRGASKSAAVKPRLFSLAVSDRARAIGTKFTVPARFAATGITDLAAILALVLRQIGVSAFRVPKCPFWPCTL